MPLKPAEEMCFSFSGRGSFGVPTETVAKERGIESREERRVDILGILEMLRGLGVLILSPGWV